MAVTKPRLLLWLFDAVCGVIIALGILHFRDGDLGSVQSLIQLPPALLCVLSPSLVSSKRLPESWRDPFKNLSSSKWIRLCKINRTENDGFHFHLMNYLLDNAPPYRALSYTWGPAEGGFVPHDGDRLEWLVDGQNRSLPMNLILALSKLSDGDLSGYYWIDALCIDQLNEKERNEQVMNMDKIFSRAAAVNVWLGKAYPDTQKINGIVQDLISQQNQEQKWSERPNWSSGEHLLPTSDWETLVQIFSRRWFHRLWTSQEFALAKKVNLLCGNVTIDITSLLKAARFLSDHQIPMMLSYGNEKRTITPPILPMSSLQQAIQGHEMLEFDFLRCFSDLEKPSQIDYETLLVWVYSQSMTKIATDSRDYVFGIAGVTNALANKMGLHYKPLKIDYSLTAAEAFQTFIMRIMKGRFGIRAISIVRRTADFAIQHPNNVKTEGLPSWVPDLANRNCGGLSTHGSLDFMEAQHLCQKILGQHSAGNRYRSLTVTGSALHIHAHSIGKIQGCSQVVPNQRELLQCSNFPLSLVHLLIQLSETYQRANLTPIEALLHTLRLDIDPSTTKYARKAFGQAAFERYLVQALQILVWNKSMKPNVQSVKQTMSWLTHSPSHNPWKIAGLTRDFPTPNTLASSLERHQLSWLLQKGDSMSEDIQKAVSDLIDSCTAFRKAFSARAEGTKLFLVQLDDGDYEVSSGSSASSRAHQRLPDSRLLLGIGPDSIEGGDEVWAAAGTEWPFIIKRHPRHEAVHHKDGESMTPITYQFKGEAFVHGIMHGELFESRAPEWQPIILE